MGDRQVSERASAWRAGIAAHPVLCSVLLIGLVGAMKIAFVLPAALADPNFGLTPDAGVYIRTAGKIIAGKAILDHHELLTYAPGYAWFLAVLGWLSIEGNAGYVTVNTVLGVGIALVYFAIARRMFSTRFALIVALVISFNPNLFYYQTTILTEPLFAFLTGLILWMLVYLVQEQGLSMRTVALLALSIGVLAGSALVVRHVMLMFPGFLVVLAVVQYLLKRWSWRRGLLLVVLGSLPVMAVAEVWSQKNLEAHGIDGVRAFGQHFYLWRGPAIISRATGRDRHEIKLELTRALPPELEDDHGARNDYQVAKFREIARQYPLALLADVAEGVAKVMIAPAQAPLQTYFADAFGERLFLVDFIGFGQGEIDAWVEFADKAPGYLILLAFSIGFVLAIAAGSGIAVVSLPQLSADKKAFGITLVLLALYFIVLSSSSSLDARFRTPFAGILAILATMGLRTLSYAIRDWYVQGGLRKHLSIAHTIMRSGEPVAYLAAALKLLRLAALPFDFLLSLVSVRYDEAAARRTPVVFVIGNHRSGTTLVAQTLCQRLFVTPLANVSVLFPNAPIVYALLRHWLRKPYRLSRAHNFYGFSTGLLGVSDIYEVWNRWFGGDRSHPVIEDRDEIIDDIRRYTYTLYQAGGMPVLAKNNRATLVAGLLAEALPEAVFICVSRRPEAVVRSLLTANKAFYGDPRYVWGLRPDDGFPRVAPEISGDPERDALSNAARQQVGLEATIERELSQLPGDRLIRVSFEDVTGPNGETAVAALAAMVADRTGGRVVLRDVYPDLVLDSRPLPAASEDGVVQALTVARAEA